MIHSVQWYELLREHHAYLSEYDNTSGLLCLPARWHKHALTLKLQSSVSHSLQRRRTHKSTVGNTVTSHVAEAFFSEISLRAPECRLRVIQMMELSAGEWPVLKSHPRFSAGNAARLGVCCCSVIHHQVSKISMAHNKLQIRIRYILLFPHGEINNHVIEITKKHIFSRIPHLLSRPFQWYVLRFPNL